MPRREKGKHGDLEEALFTQTPHVNHELAHFKCAGSFFFFWLHWVFAVICKLPTVVVCLVVEHRLYLGHVGLGVMAQGLNFPMACGVFPNQELNPCPLHCKADS